MLLLDSQNPPCKALEFRNGKYWCGLFLSPEKYNEAIASLSNSEISRAREWIGFCVGIGLGTADCEKDYVVR